MSKPLFAKTRAVTLAALSRYEIVGMTKSVLYSSFNEIFTGVEIAVKKKRFKNTL